MKRRRLDVRASLVSLSLVSSLLFWSSGCESGGCEPLEQRDCVCAPGDGPAVQFCRFDSTGWDECLCAPATTDAGPPRDGGPRDGAVVGDAGRHDGGPPATRDLDLLVVMDNSNSMSEEQMLFAAELPRLVGILASGDANQDGDALDPGDFVPFERLQFGVVTTDMGVGGVAVPTCSLPVFGDDGVLRTEGRTDLPGCLATYPSFMAFEPAMGGDPSSIGRDYGCVSSAGTGGCGFAQPLEAMLKALSPAGPRPWTSDAFVPPVFFGGTRGHGDDDNYGFVREDSILAVIVVTDGDDCSARDPDLFNPASPVYGATDLNLRCFAHADAALHPVARYVDGLLQLRRYPERVVYAVIAGIPSDLAPGEADFDRLVSPDPAVRDDRMEERVDPSTPNRLVPSCDTSSGLAFPPVRVVRVAQELRARGARVGVQSICDEASINDALRGIIRAIAQ